MIKSASFTLSQQSLQDLTHFARLLRDILYNYQQPLTLLLRGDLGTGKTTFAKYLIHFLCNTPLTHIQSPTFPLLQTYSVFPTKRELYHYDMYRLACAEEAENLGVTEALTQHICLIEWPERITPYLPKTYLTLTLSYEKDSTDTRTISCEAYGETMCHLLHELNQKLLTRFTPLLNLIPNQPLKADASQKRFYRNPPFILVGFPEQSHQEAFIRAQKLLTALKINVPQLYHAYGLYCLLEDLGDTTLAEEVAKPLQELGTRNQELGLDPCLRRDDVGNEDGKTASCHPCEGRDPVMLYQQALDMLHQLHQIKTKPDNHLTEFDLNYFNQQLQIHPQHPQFWPQLEPLIKEALTLPKTLVLRDFHGRNLMVITNELNTAASSASPSVRSNPEKYLDCRASLTLARNDEVIEKISTDKRRLRPLYLIDFEDMGWGPIMYDAVSLLQDSRLPELKAYEPELLEYYLQMFPEQDGYKNAYHLWGLVRQLRISALFEHLAQTGKPQYLVHMPLINYYIQYNAACLELEGFGDIIKHR